MKPANQSRNDVRVFWVVVVTGAVQVRGHDTTVVHPMALPVLAVVAFTELDSSYLCDGVWLIGRFKDTRKQSILTHWLCSQFWIDTARTEKQKLFHPTSKSRINDVGLDHQVLVDKVSWIGVICMNAAHFSRGQIDLVRHFSIKERSNGTLICKV